MKTTYVIVLALVLSLSANAQSGQPKDTTYDPPAWAQINDSLGHVLDLTNDQMKLVQQADENYRANAKAGDKDAVAKREKDLRALMLPTQFDQWQKLVRDRRPAP